MRALPRLALYLTLRMPDSTVADALVTDCRRLSRLARRGRDFGYKLGLTGSRSVRHGAHRCWRLVALVSTVQLSLVSLKQCGYLHAGGVAVASFSLVEPHPTDESAFCDSMGSATVSRLGGLALPHLGLTDLFVSL